MSLVAKEIDPDIKARIVSDYLRGDAAKDVATRHGVDFSMVFVWVRRAGGRIRTNAESKRRYTLNEGAFATLTDDAAYWIGFILADGCVVKPKGFSAPGVLTVCLSSCDRAHLESLNAFLGSDRPLAESGPQTFARAGKEYTSKKATRLTANSLPLVADLVKWGITERKSHTASVHPDLAGNPHFWRGVVDGDGTVTWMKSSRTPNRKRYPFISLVGTQAVCQSFCEFVARRIPTCEGIVSHRHRSIWDAKCAGNKALEVCRLLYDCDGPALLRKRATAREFIEQHHPIDLHPARRPDITPELLAARFAELGEWRAVAESLGASPHTVISYRRRFGLPLKRDRRRKTT